MEECKLEAKSIRLFPLIAFTSAPAVRYEISGYNGHYFGLNPVRTHPFSMPFMNTSSVISQLRRLSHLDHSGNKFKAIHVNSYF